jgi:hypothetical protein
VENRRPVYFTFVYGRKCHNCKCEIEIKRPTRDWDHPIHPHSLKCPISGHSLPMYAKHTNKDIQEWESKE